MLAPDTRHHRRFQAGFPLIAVSEFGQPPLSKEMLLVIDSSGHSKPIGDHFKNGFGKKGFPPSYGRRVTTMHNLAYYQKTQTTFFNLNSPDKTATGL
jgi:hypothetical protein